LPYFEVMRARMILLAAEGLQNDEIAARLNTRREVVSKWRKRFFYERLPGLEEHSRPGRPRAFPPAVIVQVKALACELPASRGLPLSRMSTADVAREVRRAGIAASISDKTVWRWLHEDAIRPWRLRSAHRVFWTMDNGSSHRGQACIDRIQQRWPTVVPVHTPVHASWLNQVEIYFSILQRKALTPNDFPSLDALEERLHGFARYYESIAKPFEWSFTRTDLDSLMDRIDRAHAREPFRLPMAA
jgi:transposase